MGRADRRREWLICKPALSPVPQVSCPPPRRADPSGLLVGPLDRGRPPELQSAGGYDWRRDYVSEMRVGLGSGSYSQLPLLAHVLGLVPVSCFVFRPLCARGDIIAAWFASTRVSRHRRLLSFPGVHGISVQGATVRVTGYSYALHRQQGMASRVARVCNIAIRMLKISP